MYLHLSKQQPSLSQRHTFNQTHGIYLIAWNQDKQTITYYSYLITPLEPSIKCQSIPQKSINTMVQEQTCYLQKYWHKFIFHARGRGITWFLHKSTS